MKFYRCSVFATFVLLTVDRFVGHDDGLLEQQKQQTFPLILKKINTEETTETKYRSLP